MYVCHPGLTQGRCVRFLQFEFNHVLVYNSTILRRFVLMLIDWLTIVYFFMPYYWHLKYFFLCFNLFDLSNWDQNWWTVCWYKDRMVKSSWCITSSGETTISGIHVFSTCSPFNSAKSRLWSVLFISLKLFDKLAKSWIKYTENVKNPGTNMLKMWKILGKKILKMCKILEKKILKMCKILEKIYWKCAKSWKKYPENVQNPGKNKLKMCKILEKNILKMCKILTT